MEREGSVGADIICTLNIRNSPVLYNRSAKLLPLSADNHTEPFIDTNYMVKWYVQYFTDFMAFSRYGFWRTSFQAENMTDSAEHIAIQVKYGVGKHTSLIPYDIIPVGIACCLQGLALSEIQKCSCELQSSCIFWLSMLLEGFEICSANASKFKYDEQSNLQFRRINREDWGEWTSESTFAERYCKTYSKWKAIFYSKKNVSLFIITTFFYLGVPAYCTFSHCQKHILLKYRKMHHLPWMQFFTL